MKKIKTIQKAQDRIDVLKRIEQFEKEGRFNDDVEIDAPAKPIKPNEVDYINKKLSSKFKTFLANKLGKMYFETMIKKHKFIIKEINGLENVKAINGGAIVTCNHFNIRDNYVVYRCLKPTFKRGQYLYKVIKESNYTNFKGIVRLMMRHANTLPLSSNYETMKSFYNGIEKLLNRGEKILIYPEQAMWWNYKKPRPFKKGAFQIASKFNKPILPVFIAMKDSNIIDNDGFFVQEYYVYFLPPIYPDENLTNAENTAILCEKNYKLWVETYEHFYKTKLEY